MKKCLILFFLISAAWFTGCATSNNSAKVSDREETFRSEEDLANSKINNKRLEKNLDKFASELDLSKRQQKQLKKIDRRYARMERKLSRKNDDKRGMERRRDRKRLAEEKIMEIIDILSQEQEQKLEALMKKGRFSFDQLFGK